MVAKLVKNLLSETMAKKKTVEEQIAAMSAQGKSKWVKADWEKYAKLLEKQNAGEDNQGEKKKTPAAKAKPAKKNESEEGPEPTFPQLDEDGNEKFQKVVPPKKKFDGSGDYENWRRGIHIWSAKYTNVSDKRLGSELMEIIEDCLLLISDGNH